VNGVYWIYGTTTGALGREVRNPLPLAVVLCPRGGRDLEREMAHLKRSGVQTLVSLLSHEQVQMLDLGSEGELARRQGMEFLHFPLPDHQLPPDSAAFSVFVRELARRVHAREHIGIHCWGSIGRATVTTACTLMHLGWDAHTALSAVEEARGCPVPDTEEQERWILGYKANP
jgi:protein-tyrosine phosphatase